MAPPRPAAYGSDYAIDDDPGAWPESSADLYTPPEPWPDEAYTRPGDEPEPVVAAFATLHRAMTAPTAQAVVTRLPRACEVIEVRPVREVTPAPVGRALSGFAARRLASK